MDMRILFVVVHILWNYSVMAAHLYVYTKNTELYTLGENFMLSELISINFF